MSKDFENLPFDEQLDALNRQLVQSPNNSEVYILRGLVYLRKDLVQEALEDFEYAINVDSENVEAHICRAYLLCESDDTCQEAVDMILGLYKINQDNHQIIICLADLYYSMSEYEKALSYYKKATEFTVVAMVYTQIAIIYGEKGEHDAAFSYFSKALSLEKSLYLLKHRALLYRKLHMFEKAFDDCTEAIAIANDPTRFYWLRADILIKDLSNISAAIDDYNQMLTLNPQNDKVLSKLGYIYSFKLKKYDEAIEYWVKAMELNPGNHITYNHYALLLNKKKRYSDALIEIEKGLSLKPNNYELMCNKGVTLWSLDTIPEALTCLNRAIEINPKPFLAYLFKSWILEEVGDYDKALRSCTRGINARGGDYLLYLWRSNFYYTVNANYTKAIDDLHRAIDLEPEEYRNYLTRAQLYIKEFWDYNAAHDDIQTALKLAPESPYTLAFCSRFYYENKRYDKYARALQYINKAISLRTSEGDYYYIRGGLYFEIGEYELAEKDLLHCLDIVTDAVVLEEVEELLEEIGNFYEECA